MIESFIKILEDNKASDISIFDISSSYIAKNVVICSSLSERHSISLIEKISERASIENFNTMLDGTASGEWSICYIPKLDLITHVMTPQKRLEIKLEDVLAKKISKNS
jgi:ribosome silencing factor RsfS/YbeB/iojap